MMKLSSAARLGLFATASAIALGGLSTAAQAGGFYLQEQSVKAAGRAFSGEVSDQGAESLWWNPAAIAGATHDSAYIGASAILPRAHVRDNGTLIVRPGQAPTSVGGNPDAKNPIDNGVLPSGAIGYRLNDQFALGLALTSPFSFSTNYDANSWARYTADKTKLRTIDIQPSIAFAPSPMIGIGAAINVEHSSATLSDALPNLSPLLADGQQQLKGKGWDVGYSVGVQFHPSSIIDLGLSYKSSIKHTLDGNVVISGLLGPLAGQNATIATKATFRTPWQLIAGGRIKASDRLTLNGQIVRIGWNKFDAIRLGAPINAALPENYRNTWSVAGGLDYAVTPKWTMRSGIQWDQTPTRNGQRDARVPDSDRINFAIGTSYKITDSITLDGAANYIHFRDATVDKTTAAYAGTPVQTPIVVNGRITGSSAIVLALGGRISF
jgi:long-chain fatty acid transport protein